MAPIPRSDVRATHRVQPAGARSLLWHDPFMTPFQSPAGDIAYLIQTSVGPVFLVSGVGVTLNVLTTRLARIIDRARVFETQLAAGTEPPAQLAEMRHALIVLARRARHISRAMTFATLSALLAAIVVVLLFADAFIRWNIGAAIATMFIASLLSLVGAFVEFLIEVRIATAALRIGEHAHRHPPR